MHFCEAFVTKHAPSLEGEGWGGVIPKLCQNKNKKDKNINDDTNLFLNQAKYITKKELKTYLDSKKDVLEFIDLHKKGVLNSYCRRNKFKYTDVLNYIKNYNSLSENVIRHNREFIEQQLIENEEYLKKS